ncbi:MAG: CRTAC1 family protein, partial [Planctomycetes bacterium]|nr:CRTAC1 family protein [Planctomycetota bacterium]
KDGTLTTCHPQALDPVPNECFLNQGDGTFRKAAAQLGLRGRGSKSLGVVIADMTGDGLPDIFVANDTTANFLFVNTGKGRFREEGMRAGCAMSGGATFQASMGVAWGDYDRNGSLDLYVTHFTDDSNTMYRNLGAIGFEDVTRLTGLHEPTLKYLGFGTIMADFDHDGRQEIFVTNGHISDWRDRGELLTMPAQLFAYTGKRWVETSDQAGPFFQKEFIGRAVAVADYDNDGDFDLAVVHQNAPMALLKNESRGGHWLRVRLIGRTSNRHGIGAVITVKQGDLQLVQYLIGGGSYCSAHQPVALFGFGPSQARCTLSVRWPSGIVQTVDNVEIDRILTLSEPEK